MDTEKDKNKFALPISIIIAAVLIGGALLLAKNQNAGNQTGSGQQANTAPTIDINVKPIDASDHILGNPNAKLSLVEYSDTECPFCKKFQTTMNQLMDKYGKDGTINWVYRHFPLDKPDSSGRALHSKSGKEAQATECAFDLGGEAKFWKYLDSIYQITPSNNGLDPAKLPELAKQNGLDVTKFQACLDSGKYKDKVEAMYQSGITAGVSSTPNTIIISKTPISKAAADFITGTNAEIAKQANQDVMLISKDSTKVILLGALPYDLVDQVIAKIAVDQK